MGRPEKAVTASTRQLRALMLWLRARRRRRGLTYTAMANSINHKITASVLSRAASGAQVPSRAAVEAYIEACSATAELPEGLRL